MSRWLTADNSFRAITFEPMASIPPRLRDRLDAITALVPGPTLSLDQLTVRGEGSFASAFDVDGAALAAAALANLALGVATVDRSLVQALMAGKVRVNGEPVPQWADLSGYYRTSDGGLIQFHCNFPHHAAGIVAHLGCEPTRESIQRAVLRHDPFVLEAELITAGLIAARLRSLDEWDGERHATATCGLPLLSVERIGDGDPRPRDRKLRVLDCSRVLAGPVAGLTFAAHGADVLLVGAPQLPAAEFGVLSTGSGKRNTFADLDTVAGRADFGRLLGDADVWIEAYRPGAFAAKGFPPQGCAPGSVIVQLCAFDWVGPWANRRGFDSIVQSTTGIMHAGSMASGSDVPVPLPVQALDYCTGLLAAFAAAQLVAHQSEHGGTWLARLSLLRTRNWLVSLAAPQPFVPAPAVVDPSSLHTVDTPFGAVTTARPIAGHWPHGPQPLGSSPPHWLPR